MFWSPNGTKVAKIIIFICYSNDIGTIRCLQKEVEDLIFLSPQNSIAQFLNRMTRLINDNDSIKDNVFLFINLNIRMLQRLVA